MILSFSFFDNIHRFSSLNFVPTQEDLIMLYVPTVGVNQTNLEYNNQDFLIYDFSGRLMERKRWLSLYDTFDALFYSIAISEFDQRFEDSQGKHSKLVHALDLFEQVCNEDKVKNVPIHVFLNEIDIFGEKLERLELKAYFTDYNGSTEKEAVQFFVDYCLEKSKNRPGKVFVYPTIAINTKKTQKVLTDIFKKL
uniref:GTP-binding protein n=1 Tax=Bursaphelenchus xylophilus TaxID=6326 RepID=A0A1I7S9W4_BURXY